MYDLIILGSGPAGLSAAIYAKRAELNTIVIEKAPMSGGQVINTYEVENGVNIYVTYEVLENIGTNEKIVFWRDDANGRKKS